MIPLATPSDKTTVLPGFGAEKAALEQEKSDEIAALAALYPDANPAQFCDPTPFEAKSPDITEFIAPAPINGTKPASAESVHYAEGQKKEERWQTRPSYRLHCNHRSACSGRRIRHVIRRFT